MPLRSRPLPRALETVEPVDSQPRMVAQAHGRGVIVLTAHIGLPKFIMNWLLNQHVPLLVWSNAHDLPAWQAAA